MTTRQAQSETYGRIERALTFIADNADDQPDLERIAAAAGLSATHLQRVFTAWVGVSPKKFLQHLTLGRAKAALAASASVLDAAYESGLSAPSRLHDLFVTHEAVTPGEFKHGGEGLTITHGWADSPFGSALVMTTPRGVCGLAFALGGDRAAALADMTARWPRARFVADDRAVARQARAAFTGGTLHLVLHGTPFQVKVWEALLTIPPGALVAYDDLARRIGKPSAARAVGSAVGDNPISYLIPCHRVIRKSGAISHYHWGRARKLAMIGWEAEAAERGRSAA